MVLPPREEKERLRQHLLRPAQKRESAWLGLERGKGREGKRFLTYGGKKAKLTRATRRFLLPSRRGKGGKGRGRSLSPITEGRAAFKPLTSCPQVANHDVCRLYDS